MSVIFRLLAIFALAGSGTFCVAGSAPADKVDAELRWIDRPWEYRYLLQVVGMDYQKYWEEKVKSSKAVTKPLGRVVADYFKPTVVLPVPIDTTDDESNFVITRIDVTKDRFVMTQNNAGLKLAARLNHIEHIVLAPDLEKIEFVVDFGDFFMGTFAAADPRYSPTICNSLFGDSTTSFDFDRGRYTKRFVPGAGEGYFGCREWAVQLYDGNRRYIDVTSYEMEEDYSQDKIKKGKRKGKYPLIPVTYVRRFIGFSRYQDPPKPVIGNHKGTWVCFNDCPDGDAPGIIPDVQAWVAKHHWPMPRKPKNVREFMDKTPDQIDLEE